MSALHLACHHGHNKSVKILLEAAVKVDIRDQVARYVTLAIIRVNPSRIPLQAEDTPLIYACCNGHSDVVILLINDGANPNATNRVRAKAIAN